MKRSFKLKYIFSEGEFPKNITKAVKHLVSYGVENKLLAESISYYGEKFELSFHETRKTYFDDVIESQKGKKKKPFIDITQMDVSKATDSEVEEAEKIADDRGLFTIECR